MGKIRVQFHYGNDKITPTVREYMFSPKSDHNDAVKFDEESYQIDVVRFENGLSFTFRLL